jgi:hypothetical protein
LSKRANKALFRALSFKQQSNTVKPPRTIQTPVEPSIYNRNNGNSTITIKTRIKPPTEEEYLEDLSPEKLENRIKQLKALDLKTASIDDIRLAFMKVISYEVPGGHYVTFLNSLRRLVHKNNYLYRVRPCIFEDMKEEKHAWNPPPEYTKMGRLNDDNESVLYVAFDMDTAIKETKIKNGDRFWIIVYDILEDIGVVSIGEKTAGDDRKTALNNIIADFLKDEFTRKVPDGMEYEYKVSNHIGKFLYAYTHGALDGWFYPSVADEGLFNLCLDPVIAKEKLKIKHVIYYQMINDDIIPEYIGVINESGIFEHELINDKF